MILTSLEEGKREENSLNPFFFRIFNQLRLSSVEAINSFLGGDTKDGVKHDHGISAGIPPLS